MFKIKGTSRRLRYDKAYVTDTTDTLYLLHYAEHGSGGLYEIYEERSTEWASEALTLVGSVTFEDLDAYLEEGLWKIVEKPQIYIE